MELAEALVASVPLKTDFYDRHERRAYLRAVEIAKRIVEDPKIIANAAAYLERHVRPDPHQRGVYDTWKVLLTREPGFIARSMLEDSDQGAELRNSAPVFVVLRGEYDLALLR
jgi:hypothetical protein